MPSAHDAAHGAMTGHRKSYLLVRQVLDGMCARPDSRTRDGGVAPSAKALRHAGKAVSGIMRARHGLDCKVRLAGNGLRRQRHARFFCGTYNVLTGTISAFAPVSQAWETQDFRRDLACTLMHEFSHAWTDRHVGLGGRIAAAFLPLRDSRGACCDAMFDRHKDPMRYLMSGDEVRARGVEVANCMLDLVESRATPSDLFGKHGLEWLANQPWGHVARPYWAIPGGREVFLHAMVDSILAAD